VAGSNMNKPETIKIVTWGGFGDILLLTPALRALKQVRPGITVKVFCQRPRHYELLKHNPNIDVLKLARLQSAPLEMGYLWVRRTFLKKREWDGFVVASWGAFGPLSYNVGHASEILGEVIGVPIKDRKLEVFLTKKEDQNGRKFMSQYALPVVIHTTSRSSPNKSWPRGHWDELIRRNPEVTFIQLGSPNDERIEETVDLRGKLSLRESLALLKYAKSFVGVESFLGHGANAVGTYGVVLFGPSPPHAVEHATNISVTGDLPLCAPCMEILFRSPCPYGRECMASIAVEDVERALKAQIQASLQ
jgi:ADP-heptose:LPS heptosyltransferase